MMIKSILKSFIIGVSVLLASTLISTAFASSHNNFSPDQVKAIQKIIKNYLITNPQVLVEASQALRQRQVAQMEKNAIVAIKANKRALFDNPNSPAVGNPNPKAILVEFFDYQCGHCKAMATAVNKLLQKNKNVKIIFKELPIFGGNSLYAAKVALAAAKQGKYYEVHEKLLTTPNPLDKAKVNKAIESLGLNMAQLQKDINSPEIQKQIRDNFKLMRALKIMGTPAFIIANAKQTKFAFIPGAIPLENLQAQMKNIEKSNG